MSEITVKLNFENGTELDQCITLPAIIGRDNKASLVLNSWRAAKQHAKLLIKQNEIWVEDLGSLMGTLVNGKRISIYGPLKPSDEIIIANCLILVKAIDHGQLDEKPIANLVDSSYAKNTTTPVKNQNLVLKENDLSDRFINKPTDEVYSAHRKRLHEKLITALQLKRSNINEMSDAALRFEANKTLTEIINNDSTLPANINRDDLRQQLLDEAVGLGPIEALLRDPEITEIMVNSHKEIFVEKSGQLLRENSSFSSEQAVLGIIDRIVAPIGRRIDDSSPMVDARLKDGSRVNAIIAPIALRGASLTIRKFPSFRLDMNDLLKVGALDKPMSIFLNTCVRYKKNILISGGTGSGKTSLLNILSNSIPLGERVITIEDAAELRLNHSHQVNLEARPENAEGRGLITIRDLVRNSLRMRPDRIVVGECRGAEAFDMLAAMNTGHEGSLTTLHANSPRDAIARLETMVLMAGMDIPLAAIREHIASAINVIVQLIRVPDGRRLISSIVQITGIESGRIQIQDIFVANSGPPAVFSGCGLLPEGFADIGELNIDFFSQTNQMIGKAGL